MTQSITGSCCCGKVIFSLKNEFSNFYFCHCEQCRKLTGSAHASNLFTSPENITWNKGKALTKRYDHPNRSFTQVFCTECGSGLPFLSQNGKFLIVPAGSLDQEPNKMVDAHIFSEEQTDWHQQMGSSKKFAKFPE